MRSLVSLRKESLFDLLVSSVDKIFSYFGKLFSWFGTEVSTVRKSRFERMATEFRPYGDDILTV